MKPYSDIDTGKLPKPFQAGITATEPPSSRCLCTWTHSPDMGGKPWVMKFYNKMCPVRHGDNGDDEEEWLLPTPTAREKKGSHGRIRTGNPDRKASIKNLDLSAIVKLIAAEDPRVMGGGETPGNTAESPEMAQEAF